MKEQLPKPTLKKRAIAAASVGFATLALLSACKGEDKQFNAVPSSTPHVGTVRIDSDNIEVGPKTQQLIDRLAATAVANAAAGKPTETPKPSATKRPESAVSQETCDVMAVTSLPERPSAHVNGIGVRLDVRDTNQCIRDLFYSETGVGKTQDYKLDIPAGWTAITASVSATVNSDTAPRKEYTSGPEVIIRNFVGTVTIREGALYIMPNEWAQKRSEEILSIQRQQTKNPNLQPTIHQDNR